MDKRNYFREMLDNSLMDSRLWVRKIVPLSCAGGCAGLSTPPVCIY